MQCIQYKETTWRADAVKQSRKNNAPMAAQRRRLASRNTNVSERTHRCRQKCHKCSPGFTLALEKGKDILLPDGALDIADESTGLVVHELNADLRDASTRTSTAENLERDVRTIAQAIQ